MHGRKRFPDVDDGPVAGFPVGGGGRVEDAGEVGVCGGGVVVDVDVWDGGGSVGFYLLGGGWGWVFLLAVAVVEGDYLGGAGEALDEVGAFGVVCGYGGVGGGGGVGGEEVLLLDAGGEGCVLEAAGLDGGLGFERADVVQLNFLLVGREEIRLAGGIVEES